MQPSIYTRIIKGELPSHKVYEDEHVYAFLDIHPFRPGHTLVVPKKQVDRMEDLPEAEYEALMLAVKKVMRRVVEVYGEGYRACLLVMGFDVPHVHVHVVPCRSTEEILNPNPAEANPDHTALAAVAKKLAF